LPVLQLLAMRGAIITIVLLMWLPRVGGIRILKRQPWHWQVLRILFAFIAPVCFFTALKNTPLADATIIMFSATFIMTALSTVLFGDVIGRWRWFIICSGFIGVCIALRPTGNVSVTDAGLLLLGAFSYACLMLSVRWMGNSVSTFSLVFYTNFGTCLLAALTLPFIWQAIDPLIIAGLVLMAILALGGHVFITRAFRMAPVPVVAPFEYTAIIWAMMFGILFWGDVPDLWLALGAIVISVSGILSIQIEKRDTSTSK